MTIVMIVFLFLINFDRATSSAGGALYNAALYKPAYQSSLYQNFYPYFGNDGHTTGYCQHTQNDATPWWMVDLKGQFVIVKLVVTNSYENPTRLRNFAIDIFKTDPRQLPKFPSVTGQICYNQSTALSSGTFTWQCPSPIVGRFVRLIMFTKEFFHICELEVYVNDAYYKESSFIMKLNRILKMAPIMTTNVTDVMSCTQHSASHKLIITHSVQPSIGSLGRGSVSCFRWTPEIPQFHRPLKSKPAVILLWKEIKMIKPLQHRN